MVTVLPMRRQSKAMGACSRWSGTPKPSHSLAAVMPPPSLSSLQPCTHAHSRGKLLLQWSAGQIGMHAQGASRAEHLNR